MRTLLLLRGAPGCGKSTFIKLNGLEPYALSPDTIRMMYSSPKMNIDGSYSISQELDDAVWMTLFQILESRMERGEFTVIDATNSKTKDMNKYKELCDTYRYKIFCVDFTDVPLKTCLEQNKQRPELKQVPQKAIENIYARFKTQPKPSGIHMVSRANWEQEIFEEPFDLSNYKKIVHISDVHGCYDTLMQYFNDNPFNDEYEYIFNGDFIDRGNQNAEVFKFLNEIKDKKNVCLIQGNHERSLFAMAYGYESNSREFNKKTKFQLINAGITDKEARMFVRKIRQCSYYKFHDKEVLVCHGGIPSMSRNLMFVPTNDLINGVGEYKDYQDVAEAWFKNTKENQYLIHGHRNIGGTACDASERVFNLEGGVEFGGELRIVELDENGFHCLSYDNIQPKTESDYIENETINEQEPLTVEHAIELLRQNRFVQEKELGGNISSFNFTREAFMKSNWDNQTILARGFFVDVERKEIVARSYEKFFRINETMETRFSNLSRNIEFPLTAYVKENGYLGIVSYNPNKDDLFIASKSTSQGDFANKIRELIDKKYNHKKILDFLKGKNETLVFEVEDPEFDPHIIKYDEARLVLLDCIENSLSFKKRPYKEVMEIAKELGIPCKRKAFEFQDWQSFSSFYFKVDGNYDYQYEGEYIEGFVFEDAKGFMFKMKTEYYNEWKKMRGVADSTLKRGYISKTSMLTTATENLFYGYLKDLYQNYFDKDTKTYPFKTDIISLREGFEHKA